MLMPTVRMCCAVVVAMLLLAPAASGADKPYSVVVSNPDLSTPATLVSGQQGDLVATYRNLTGQQQLGSSDLTVPSGLQAIGATVAPRGTATVVGNVIRLRDLAVPAGGSAAVTVTLLASGCGTRTLLWPAPVTKQANDFNGSPGNDLNLRASASDLRTVVSGGCALRFLTQPADARTAQTITGSRFDPAGPPVAVEVVDGGGARVTSSSASITLAIGTNPSGGALAGTSTMSAVNGVATFANLSIDRAGVGYTLAASSPGATSAVSDAFAIQQVAISCSEDVDCTGAIPLAGTGGGSSVQVTAIQGAGTDVDTGFLTLSLAFGGPLDCAGYQELAAAQDVTAVDFTGVNREKQVVTTIDKRVMNATANNGAAFLEKCFGAPYRFDTKLGTPLEVNAAYVPGPYQAPEYKGLLPNCGGAAQRDDPSTPAVDGPVIASAGAPCVLYRKKSQAGDGIIASRLPAGGADPRFRS